jgi:Glycosyl hydrolase family 71
MVFKLKSGRLMIISQLVCLMAVLNGCSAGGSSSNTGASAAAPDTIVGSTGSSPSTSTTTPPESLASASAATVTATNSGDACLPFTMPTRDVLFGSSKKVFAHYFYPFPLSIDNRSPAKDYYNTQFLNKEGESNKWSAQGGFLRQRPLPVNASSDPHWQQINMQREVTTAIARGITGFAFDVMSVDQATNANSQLHLMLNAAQAVDSRFKIMIMPDITALGTNADAVVQIIQSVAKSPSAYKLADGRLVVSAFDANLNSPAWWQGVLNRLKTAGINTAFVPTFLGWTNYADLFQSISYGYADWGTATAHASSLLEDDPSIAHASFNKIFMMPVDSQQFRPKNYQFWEAGNSASFRTGWNNAIQGKADWVQLVTWNDYSESGEVSPYTDNTLNGTIGTGYYNLNGYYATWFLTGHAPTITHDVLYYFYRREPTNARAPRQSQGDHVAGSDAAENSIELLAFLTAPTDLKIAIGGKTYTHHYATGGVVSFKVPSQPGTPTFTVSRGNLDVFSFKGGVPIYGVSGLPSGVADMTYWSGSASHSGVCSL